MNHEENPMPVYSLLHKSADDAQWVDCGSVAVSAAGITYLPRGHRGAGTPINGARYTPKAGGGGSPDKPAVGDVLFLNDYSATGSDNKLYTFDQDATYRDAQPSENAGYYHCTGLPGDDDDWAASGGTPEE
jgi:hypothetical protein